MLEGSQSSACPACASSVRPRFALLDPRDGRFALALLPDRLPDHGRAPQPVRPRGETVRTGPLTLGGNGGTGRSRQPRLGIVDIYELDRQRQLILLRRDNTEHLLLVGGPNDVVVERNIVRTGTARVSAEIADRSEPESEAPLPLPAGTEPAPLPPPFPEPELPRPPAPEPERVAAAFAPVRAPGRSPAPRGPGPGRRAARSSSRFKASRRVEPPSLRAARQTPPPLEVPPAAEAALFAAPAFTAPVPPVVPVPPPMPEPVVPSRAGARAGRDPRGRARTVDAAILNDMARQLEEALRRPSSAVAPARPTAPAIPAPVMPDPPPEPEPAPPESRRLLRRRRNPSRPRPPSRNRSPSRRRPRRRSPSRSRRLRRSRNPSPSRLRLLPPRRRRNRPRPRSRPRSRIRSRSRRSRPSSPGSSAGRSTSADVKASPAVAAEPRPPPSTGCGGRGACGPPPRRPGCAAMAPPTPRSLLPILRLPVRRLPLLCRAVVALLFLSGGRPWRRA